VWDGAPVRRIDETRRESEWVLARQVLLCDPGMLAGKVESLNQLPRLGRFLCLPPGSARAMIQSE
jgi:hypothetical protein